MARDNWGKWGADDQRGALNRIGPEQTRHAASLVREGRVFSLAQPLSAATPMPPKRQPVSHYMVRDGGDYAAGTRSPGGFSYAEDVVVMPLHSGTHIDGLCHVWCDRLMYNGFPENTMRSNGASRLGIDTMTPIVTRGVLLDFVAVTGKPLADGEAIGPDLVGRALDRAGTDIREGDAVLIRTGWQETRGQQQTADFNAEPGLDVEAARRLAEAGASVIGADNYAVEVLPFAKGTVFPVHQLLIRDHGIALIEGLVLAPLAEAGAKEFLFSTAPLPIVGGTGSPLVPVAVL